MVCWQDAAWHSLLCEGLIRKNHAYSSSHKQLLLQLQSEEKPRKHSWKVIFHSPNIFTWRKGDSETKYRQRTARPTTGRGLRDCIARSWIQCPVVQDHYVICTRLQYFGCIYARIMGQRCAFKANPSNLNYELWFIFQSHLRTHEQHFSWVSWPGRSAPPTYVPSWSTYSWDIGSSTSTILLYKFTSTHLHCYVDIPFRAQGKLVSANKDLHRLYSVKLLQYPGRLVYFLEGISYFLIPQYSSTWNRKNAKHQLLYTTFLNSELHGHVSVE